MSDEEADRLARVRAQLADVRASGVLGRSDPLSRLLAYLAERPDGSGPAREIEIAQEVFGRTELFDVSQDASVRVYMHRLRTKLDSFYAAAEPGSDRLVIPRGEYRLLLQSGAAAPAPFPEAMPPVEAAAQVEPPRPDRRVVIGGIVAGLVAAAGAGGFLFGRHLETALPEIAANPSWAPMLASPRPTFASSSTWPSA